MRKTSLILLPALLLSSPFAFSEIYRYVDEQGNVVFSDEPPADKRPANTVDIPHINTIPAEPLRTPTAPSKAEAPSDSSAVYDSLSIRSPAHDSTVRDNTGDIRVQVALQPALADGHQLVLFLDGVEFARGRRYNATAKNVDRGSHTLEAVVYDAKGKVLIRSPASQVHLKRFFKKPAS